jgi:DNA helicase II / ATP-dependent DNA helicase PcrA
LLTLLPGIGPVHARRVLDTMLAAPDPVAALAQARVPANAQQQWSDFLALYQRLARTGRGRRDDWPDELMAAVRWYEPHLQRLHDDHAVRLLDLEQLARLATGFGDRERFLTELTLDPPEATSDESGVPLLDEDYLILSTLHSAKGQEWQAVYLLNMVDGCLPSDLSTGAPQQLEEERRLLYVGMTRAKQHLQLIVPQRFHVTQQRALGDRHLYGGRTRFIPQDMLALFEPDGPAQRASAQAREAEAARGPLTLPPVDLRARLRSAW